MYPYYYSMVIALTSTILSCVAVKTLPLNTDVEIECVAVL